MLGEEQLEQQMVALRKDMEQRAQEKGLTDPDVLQISQKIDALHNQLNQLMYRGQHAETEQGKRTYTHKKGDLYPRASSDARVSGRFTFVKELHIPYGKEQAASGRQVVVL